MAAAFTSVNRWRRRLGVFYGDSGIFCRRKVFESLGGYAPWPILEDYDFARRLRKAGKLALLDEPIWVSDRRWRTSGLLPTLWSWFWVQGLYLAGVNPERLAGLYHPVRAMNPPRLIHLLSPGLGWLMQKRRPERARCSATGLRRNSP